MQELIRKIINSLFRKPPPTLSIQTAPKPSVQPELITPTVTQSVAENVLPSTAKWHPPIREDKFNPTQKFLNPDPLYKITGHHPGTDYGTQGENNVPLHFCADGEVIENGLHNAFGNYFFYYVPEANRTFVYFHLRDAAPKKGIYKAGKQCGITGKTGLSQGIQLHLECMKGRKTSADRARLYISKDAIAEVAEDADALIRSRI